MFSKFPVPVVVCIILSLLAGCARVITQPIVRRAAAQKAMRRRRENETAGNARPIRVAVVTQHFPTSRVEWTGHTAYQTLRVLSRHCDVHVFYPEAVYPRFLPQPRVPKLSIDRTWSPSDVKTTYIPYFAVPVLSRCLNGFTIASRLLPQVRRYNPDVILSYTVYPDGYAAVSIGRSLGVPTVVKAVGSDLHSIPDRLCRMLTKATLRRADFVSGVSHDLCNVARELGADPNRSVANLNGCNTNIFYPRDREQVRKELAIETKGNVIVFVGRLDVRKGLVELIDSCSQLLSTDPTLRCYIVGDGPDRSVLVDAIARNRAGEQIILVPSCPTEQVALWMSAADLIALPSYNEGCPNVVVEGLTSGRPIVATHVGGIPELVDDRYGRLVPPANVHALTLALEETLRQPWDATMIAAAHTKSWKDVSDSLYGMLLEALHSSPQEVEASEPVLDIAA